MSRFINDEWMMKEGFAADEGTLRGPNRTHWWTEKRVGDITLNTPITVTPSSGTAVAVCAALGIDAAGIEVML